MYPNMPSSEELLLPIHEIKRKFLWEFVKWKMIDMKKHYKLVPEWGSEWRRRDDTATAASTTGSRR